VRGAGQRLITLAAEARELSFLASTGGTAMAHNLRVFALRLRALASLLLALERRLIALGSGQGIVAGETIAQRKSSARGFRQRCCAAGQCPNRVIRVIEMFAAIRRASSRVSNFHFPWLRPENA
jgi:hypothetical protein